MTRAPTITDDYLAQQKRLHESPDYGVASLTFAPIVASIMRETQATTLTDYGAGKRRLHHALAEAGVTGYEYRPYDPAFPEYGSPQRSQIVCCIDVLEHIEPMLLANVIDELADLTESLAFLTIHLGPAIKTLPDGRNAHLIQQPIAWWKDQLSRRFNIYYVKEFHFQTPGAWLTATPKPMTQRD